MFVFKELSYVKAAGRELCKILNSHITKLQAVFSNMATDLPEYTILNLDNESPQPAALPHLTATPPQSPLTPTHPEVNFAMQLNFVTTPQIHHLGVGIVSLHKKRQPSELK